ncbi:putative tetratricopeptide-like helical domain superfamily [Helianthus anomalus]
MWVPLIRSVYRRHLVKFDRIFRFSSVSSLAQLPFSDVSDSGSEENYPHPFNNNSIASFDHAHQVFDKLSVIETLNYLKEQPNTALNLLTRLKLCGFTHDVATYMAIIRFMCYWGMISRLKFLFLEVIVDKDGAFGFNVSDLFEGLLKEFNVGDHHLFVIAVDALIKAFLNVRRFDEAFEVLLKIQGRFVLSVRTCNLFLNELDEEGEVDIVMAVYEHLKTSGFCPNVYTYGIVVKGLCRKGRVNEAEDVFREMEEIGVEFDAFMFGSYIDGLCSNGNTDLAFVLLKRSRDDGSPVDVFTYASVIRGFVRELKFDSAENVFLDMKQSAVVPDAYCYGALIQGYCKRNNLLKALDLYDNMISNGIQTNCVILSSIMQCLCHLGMLSEAVDQFTKAKESGVFLDEISYTIAIDALCRQRKISEAVLLLDEMKLKKMNPDVTHYTALINGFCLLNDLKNALKIFNEMNENGLKPDMAIFHALIGGFLKCGRYKEMMILLDNMVVRGLKPTSTTHNIVIDGLCKGGKMKQAASFFNKLETKSLNNYVALINGYCDLDNVEKAYELFVTLPEQEKTGLLLAKNGCFKLLTGLFEKRKTNEAIKLFKTILGSENGPSKIMYSKLIAACCRAGDMITAREVFVTMIARRIPPDVISYTIMLHGYFKMNCLTKAYDIFRRMIHDGIQPDIITYTVFFDGESKVKRKGFISSENGIEEKGLQRYLTKMQELTPDLIHYTVLIDHHCKSNNLQHAKFLFKEMIERGLKPDTIAYTSLIRGHSPKEYVEAQVLYNNMLRAGVPQDSRSVRALERVKLTIRENQYEG